MSDSQEIESLQLLLINYGVEIQTLRVLLNKAEDREDILREALEAIRNRDCYDCGSADLAIAALKATKERAVKYRKKSILIDAVRWDGMLDTKPDWLRDRSTAKYCVEVDHRCRLHIPTLDGRLTGMMAEPGDWIIRGVEGEIYPCKDSIFRATYEGPLVDWRGELILADDDAMKEKP